MTQRNTPRTESLVRELRALARQIDGNVLAIASPSARAEWKSLRKRWPSDASVRAGTVDVSDEELEVMAAKVRRFQKILEACAALPMAIADDGAETVRAAA